MSSLRAFGSYYLRSVLASPCGSDVRTWATHGLGFSRERAFSVIGDGRVHNGSTVKMEKRINKEKHVGHAVPSFHKRFFPTWARWTLGAILSLLSFGKEKWEGFLRIEGQVENVAEAVENVAEVVEKVAGVAEKVSGKVADKLPEDCGLKDVASLVESVSKEAAKDANFAINVIHKVEKLKQEVVEKVVEPVNEPDQKPLDEGNGEK
ncbi:uncharacterized protein LOC130758127 [Actinidia eriantha]|uniref:uncharacterized protein LOC130758127 n=1 Tax=Actinidia eriantha TaxID=165200 RepID=UPI00259040C4|nr:uncharacterized protein LOC130758127 [Actinidia eriantha]